MRASVTLEGSTENGASAPVPSKLIIELTPNEARQIAECVSHYLADVPWHPNVVPRHAERITRELAGLLLMSLDRYRVASGEKLLAASSTTARTPIPTEIKETP